MSEEKIKTSIQDQQLGQIVRHVKSIDRYNSITLRNLAKSFLLGLAGAFGATVGLAIVISVLSFFVREFGGLPLIGKLISDFGLYIRK